MPSTSRAVHDVSTYDRGKKLSEWQAQCPWWINCSNFTHADQSRGSKAFIDVCLCVCVSVHTITEPKRLKLQSPNLPQELSITSPGYPFNIRSKGQRSRSQGHKVQNHISGDRVAGVNLHRLVETQELRRVTFHEAEPRADSVTAAGARWPRRPVREDAQCRHILVTITRYRAGERHARSDSHQHVGVHVTRRTTSSSSSIALLISLYFIGVVHAPHICIQYIILYIG